MSACGVILVVIGRNLGLGVPLFLKKCVKWRLHPLKLARTRDLPPATGHPYSCLLTVVAQAIEWLVGEVLPESTAQDHELHDEGDWPAGGFRRESRPG